MLELSILVSNWNTKESLRACLHSIRKSVGVTSQEIIVVDNHSSDGSAAMVRAEFPQAKLIENSSNLGFSKAMNQAIQASSGTFLLLLNSDVLLGRDSVVTLLDAMKNDNGISLLACQLLNPDGSVQYFCRRFPSLLTAFFENTFLERIFPNNKISADFLMKEWGHDDFREVDQPPGCCWLLRKNAIDAVGVLDEKMFLFFSDVDFCLRLRRKGLRICFTPEAKVIHEHGVATKKLIASDQKAGLIWHRDRFTYYRKHHGAVSVVLLKMFLCLDFFLRTCELAVEILRRRISLRDFRKQVGRFFAILGA